MRVLRLPGAGKAALTNMVMLKQEVEVATCHARGSCVQWSQRCPEPLPDRDKYPVLSVSKSVTNQGSWSSPVDRNGLETRQKIQARLQQREVRTAAGSLAHSLPVEVDG